MSNFRTIDQLTEEEINKVPEIIPYKSTKSIEAEIPWTQSLSNGLKSFAEISSILIFFVVLALLFAVLGILLAIGPAWIAIYFMGLLF